MVENKRGRESESNLSKSKMSAIESDKGRIINSSAFRRLQQKAQVFSLETNAAVRTRLTHSFEVAQIGRFIAQEILNKVYTEDPKYIDNSILFTWRVGFDHILELKNEDYHRGLVWIYENKFKPDLLEALKKEIK